MPSRLVVISGASSGIGLATARRFAAAGDQVVNLDANAPAAGGGAGEWVAVDVRDWTALGTALGRITAVHGDIEVAIANAGISRRRLFLEMTEADAREVIDTNLMGVIGLWQAAARRMIPARSGVLLATASTNASAGYPYYADYNATKAGVLALCRTLALELAPWIRTACVSPGYVMTAMQRAEYTPAMLAEVDERIPAGRHAEPEEIAEAFYFLASPAARYITGQQLVVDGGELAGGTASSHGTVFRAGRSPLGITAARPPAPRSLRVDTAGAQDRSRPAVGGLVAVSLWGLAPVATRAAVARLAPLPLLELRLTVASLVLLPWAIPVFRRLRPRSAGRLLAAGTLGLVGYNLPVTAGLRWLPASTAGLLLATEPVWVMVLGYVFLAEHGGARAWLGSAVALGGVAVLAGPGALTGPNGYRALAGAGLILAGALAFGAYTIVLRPVSQACGAIPATAASTVIGTLPYLAFAGTLSASRLGQIPPPVWGELAFLAIGSTVAGMLLWNRAVLSGGTARVSLLLYLVPVVSVLGAAVFLGERMTPVTVAGGLLILAGVGAASTGRRPALP